MLTERVNNLYASEELKTQLITLINKGHVTTTIEKSLVLACCAANVNNIIICSDSTSTSQNSVDIQRS